MKRLYSLKGRDLFQEVFKKGKRIQGEGVRIIVLTYDRSKKLNQDSMILSNNKRLKIGISINKRYGNAFTRNKAKRRIRSICNELLNEMNDGFCVVFQPARNFKNISYEQSKNTILDLLNKAGVVQ
ncbi:MAG: ribonuclease P protein component [bacterium]|nr:ribonuclease P protein component [bacterium]